MPYQPMMTSAAIVLSRQGLDVEATNKTSDAEAVIISHFPDALKRACSTCDGRTERAGGVVVRVCEVCDSEGKQVGLQQHLVTACWREIYKLGVALQHSSPNHQIKVMKLQGRRQTLRDVVGGLLSWERIQKHGRVLEHCSQSLGDVEREEPAVELKKR